ncbi:group III truncated hemoglobin [Ferruginibacter lapsinanis]|uniref:group III truncated hemoglobin n=1 Tax=Ferruginibacter lapsinanis TaxID=563172 RepID=UPI001E4EEC67|nr:group III truncated hemoglobin [Ferruginibacter lapsinanis]UEG50199.1 group III truncated hemoglobin [Ferruginibacter lapsinanis]
MEKDITTRADIEKLIIHFYEKVKADDVIGFIFNEVVKMDWEHHTQVIVDFWESIILDNPVYQNNAMEKHYILNDKVALTKIHFERWLHLFNSSVDDFYLGEKAMLAKKRARSIADLMLFKMNTINDKKTNV